MVIGMTLLVKTCGHSGELICHSAVPSVRGPICRFAEQNKMSLPFGTRYVLRTRETSECFTNDIRLAGSCQRHNRIACFFKSFCRAGDAS
jgi:hypothetical protein